jgi:ABC-type multidrug transport system ATPase subunit
MERKKTPILEIVNLWKSYDGNPAVRGLDLEVESGEIFGLLGPNGAGKTTTLKMVVGLLRMDRGLIRVNGVDISEDQFGYKRTIGYMPETPMLPEYLTVEEFIGYVAKVRDVPLRELRKRIDYYLKVFDLEERRRELIVSLSRGMKQKLTLSTAIIHRPNFLLLDEPLVAVDPAGQRSVKDILREVVDDGGSVMVSTHMLDTVERLCNRVSIIHRGRNVATGDLDRLRGLAETGVHSTLEEIFLKLTEEAEEAEKRGATGNPRKGLFGKGSG